MERLKTVNRKIWAIVLSIAILLSLLVGIGMAFDVKAAVFEGGDGSIDKPFLISDAEGLNQIRNFPESNFVLTNTIDLAGREWEPIEAFSGSFDGQNYTIRNLTITKQNGSNVGLWGNSEGCLSNVVLENVSISLHGEIDTGFSVGALVGESTGTIENVIVSGSIDVDGMMCYVGGIAGISYSVINSTNMCSIKAPQSTRVGGVAASVTVEEYADYYEGFLFERNRNYGSISIISETSSEQVLAGGVVGSIDSSNGIKLGQGIKNCVNYGDVDVFGNPFAYSGGIVGLAHATNLTIDQCVNFGTISASISGNTSVISYFDNALAGGIVGYACYKTTIENCVNQGEIISNAPLKRTTSNGAYWSCSSGGIVGASSGGSIINVYHLANHTSGYHTYGNVGRIFGDIRDVDSVTVSRAYSINEAHINTSNPVDYHAPLSGVADNDQNGLNLERDEINSAIKPILEQLGLEMMDTEPLVNGEYYLRCLDANIELTLDGVYDNEHYQLKPEFLPKLAEGESLRYESSDSSVLSVTNTGLVEAKTEGEATITITHPVTKQSTSVKFTVLDGPRVVLASEIPLSGMGVGQTSTVYAQVKSGRQYLKDNVAFSIANSNPSVVSISNVKNKTGITSFEIKALKEGEAIITVSDSGTGALYSKHITVTSGIKSYNAASLPINYEDLTNKEFRVAINGMIVDEYEMEDLGKNWKVSFDVYNQMCHAGVVEVYNEDGSLKEYVPIKRFDGGYVTSLWGTLETICDMAKDLVDRNTLSYKDSTCSHKTEVSIDVPKGGQVVLTNDPLYSKSCAVVNMADFCTEVLLRGVSLIDKINKDDVTKSVFDVTKQKSLKLLKEEYLHGGTTMYKLGESVQDSFKSIVGQKALENLSEDALKKLFVETDQAFRRFDIDFSEIIADILNVKTGLKYGVDTIQSELIANADVFGLTLEIAFNAQKDLSILNYYIDLQKEYSNHAICVYFDAADNSLYSSDGVSAKSLSGNNTLSQKNYILHSYVLSNNEELDNKQRRALDEKSDKYVVRNIYLERDGVVSQPGEVVEVTVPVPDSYDINKCNIYWIKDDGSLAKMDSTVDGHNLVFQTTHFSLYAVVEETSSLPDSVEVLLPSDFEMSVGDTIPMFIDQLEGKYELYNYHHEFKETDTAKRANKFVSKDESIVTVDEKGNVTAHKAGTTTIIGSYGNKTAECKVTVGYPWAGYGTVSKVSLNRVSINGKTYELNLSDNSEDILYYEKTTQRALMDYIYAYKLDDKGRIVELKHPSVNGYWKLLGSRDSESYYYDVADSIFLDYPLVEKSEVDKHVGNNVAFYYVVSKWGYINITHIIHLSKSDTESDPYLDYARFIPSYSDLNGICNEYRLTITDDGAEEADALVAAFPLIDAKGLSIAEVKQLLVEHLKVLSSDESIAKIFFNDTGSVGTSTFKVQAVNAGEATLTWIHPITGMSCSAKVVVTDKRSDAGKVETVALDRTSVTFTVGDSVPLVPTATNPYGGTVTATYDWSSSDSSVVTVDKDGIAKGLKPGKASITATEKSTGKTAICEFIVEEGEDTVVVIKTPTTEVSVAQGRSQTVSVTLLNRNAVVLSKPVVWASEDESVATVNQNGVITGKAPGTTHVTASVDGQSLVIPVTVTERQSIFTVFTDIIKVVTNRLQESFNRRLQRQQAIRDLIKSIVTRQ